MTFKWLHLVLYCIVHCIVKKVTTNHAKVSRIVYLLVMVTVHGEQFKFKRTHQISLL